MKGALLSALIVVPLHTLLLNLVGQTGWDVITHKNGEVLHFIVLSAGLVVAIVRTPHVRLRKQLFERVKVEEQMRYANEALRHEMAKREGTEAVLRESNASLESALEELRKLQDRMLLDESMRALGRMASGVAHDLNNTLMPITGYTDLLLGEQRIQDGAPEAVRMLERIKTAAGNAAQTVRCLADFYRPAYGTADIAVIPVSQLVRDALDMTRPTWRSQAEASSNTTEVETNIGEAAFVSGLASELCQVIVNLILNAVDALPKGGRIVVESQRRGGTVTLNVRDTGTGMSEVVRQQCMEPFLLPGRGVAEGWGSQSPLGPSDVTEAPSMCRVMRGTGRKSS